MFMVLQQYRVNRDSPSLGLFEEVISGILPLSGLVHFLRIAHLIPFLWLQL